MARRFTIYSYDITDDKRRTRVFKTMLGFGDRVQFSVFCCQLNPRERLQVANKLKPLINQDEDQILIVDAGPVSGQNPEPEVDYLGKTWKPAPRVQIV